MQGASIHKDGPLNERQWHEVSAPRTRQWSQGRSTAGDEARGLPANQGLLKQCIPFERYSGARSEGGVTPTAGR